MIRITWLLSAGILAAACSSPERANPVEKLSGSSPGTADVEVRLEAAPTWAGIWVEIQSVALAGTGAGVSLRVTGGRVALDQPQGFHARGDVPAGRYRGLRLVLSGAWKGNPAEGGVPLLLGETGGVASFPILLQGGGRENLLLSVAPPEPGQEGISFRPRWEVALAAPLVPHQMVLAAGPGEDGLLVVDRLRMRVHRRMLGGEAILGLARGSSRNEVLAVRGRLEEAVAVDLARGTIRDRRRLPGGGRPAWATRLADGSGVAVAQAARRSVATVSLPGLLARDVVHTGRPPGRMAASSRLQRLYVLLPEDDSLLVLSGSGAEAVASTDLESRPVDLALDRDEQRLAVVARDAGRLLILDPSSLQVQQSIFLGQGLLAVEFDDRGERAFVATRRPPRILAVDLATGQSLSRVDLPAPATDLELDPEGRLLWAACPEAESLVAVDRFHLRIRGTVNVDGSPDRLLVPGLLEP